MGDAITFRGYTSFSIMPSDLTLFYVLNGAAGRSPVFDAVVIFFGHYFPYVLVLFFALLLFFSGYAKREKVRIFGVTVASMLIARLGVTELIRFLYHRPRPFVAHQVHALLIDDAWSFPSGHAALFFAMATALYLYNKTWGIGFFIAALLITVSRVIAGVHYPSDIVGGLVVGSAIAYLVFYLTEREKMQMHKN